MDAVTDDRILDGRLRIWQPRRGHRVGHDAILLAAATHARRGEHAVDLGAGIGAAGLALAARVPGARVTLVEIDERLAALAASNAERNGFADRVRAVSLDAAGQARAFARAGLPPGCAQHVLMNPPFNDARHRVSPNAERRRAHACAGDLDRWIRTAARLLEPRGALTMIWRADGLAEVLRALDKFGAVSILPIYPKPDRSAIRILVRAVKGSSAPLSVSSGLVLADSSGRPTGDAEAVLRKAQEISFGAGRESGAEK